MERTLFDWQHDYRATPSEYPIGDNNRPATYDQFITLRDTLIFSNKQYNDKAGRTLIIWTKLDWTPTDTIEIREPNLSRISFQPWYEAHPTDENYLKDETKWAYVTSGNTYTANPLSCTINKDGRYRLMHKQQFVNIDSSITRIHAYILQHYEENWTRNTRERAVFDWETRWALAGTTTDTEPDWTCSVPLSLWLLFNRMTSMWYVECDLNKWDWLELKMEDQNGNHINSATWRLWQDANWRCVEYIDLAYNK